MEYVRYPKSKKGGSKSDFFVLGNIGQLQSKKSATKFFCVKTSCIKVVVQPFSYLMVHRY